MRRFLVFLAIAVGVIALISNPEAVAGLFNGLIDLLVAAGDAIARFFGALDTSGAVGIIWLYGAGDVVNFLPRL